MIDKIRFYITPAIFVVIVLVLYQVFAWPTISDMLQDWQFLHQAKIQAIQQMQKAEQSKQKE